MSRSPASAPQMPCIPSHSAKTWRESSPFVAPLPNSMPFFWKSVPDGAKLRGSMAEERLEKPDRLLSLEELHALARKLHDLREKRLAREAKEALKPRWLLPPPTTIAPAPIVPVALPD